MSWCFFTISVILIYMIFVNKNLYFGIVD